FAAVIAEGDGEWVHDVDEAAGFGGVEAVGVVVGHDKAVAACGWFDSERDFLVVGFNTELWLVEKTGDLIGCWGGVEVHAEQAAGDAERGGDGGIIDVSGNDAAEQIEELAEIALAKIRIDVVCEMQFAGDGLNKRFGGAWQVNHRWKLGKH